jgi:hypothetical protein
VETLWRRQQQNYFYGLIEIFELTVEGLYRSTRLPLNQTPEPSDWQIHGRLSAEGLAQIQAWLTAHFLPLPPFEPSSRIPDDFAWVCTACLPDRSHQLEIFSNSPPEYRQCLQPFDQLIRGLMRADNALDVDQRPSV